MLRITRAALDFPRMAASVEGQEVRVGPAQARRHVYLVRIGREVHQCATLEAEERGARIAVFLVLCDSMSPVLASTGILELARRDWKAVDREEQVHRVVPA